MAELAQVAASKIHVSQQLTGGGEKPQAVFPSWPPSQNLPLLCGGERRPPVVAKWAHLDKSPVCRFCLD